MTEENKSSTELFPKGSGKTYALTEVMDRDGPMVGKGPDETVFAFPLILLIETVLFLGSSLLIFLFSLLKQAPLEEIANPMVTTDPAKAPWYFVGLQELLEHMHPTLAGVIIPGILVVFLLSIPYIDQSQKRTGTWFSGSTGKKVVMLTGIYAMIVMPLYIVLDNAFPLREILRVYDSEWLSQFVIPAVVLGFLVLLPVWLVWRKSPNRRNILLALFTVMIVSAIVFTVSGFLFRGPGFKLFLPWQMPDGYSPWSSF